MKVIKNSKNWRVVFILITVCLVSFPAQAKYGGGTGKPNDPYLISTAEQLNTIGTEPNDWDKHFKLTADIDLAGLNYSSAVIPELFGTLDGNGFTVRNLTMVGFDCLGLIGTIHEDGQVQNLGLVDAKIDGVNEYVGILAGTNHGDVVNCYSTGSVSGQMYVGGLAGNNTKGKTINSYSRATVTGGTFIGGLIGFNHGDVTNCYSTGEVRGDHHVGGLIGYSEFDTVTNSFWDIQTSDQTESASGTGKTTAEMQTANTFLEAGLDFMDETDNGTEDIWRIDEGRDYPHLCWEPIAEDTGNGVFEGMLSAENSSTTVELTSENDDDSSDITECFTEQFIFGTDVFDLSNKSVMFTPTTNGSFYSPVLKNITQLPTDPAGGTVLALDDDSFALVNLSNQKRVWIFGFSYIRFYVGSNGYITFTRGDTNREDFLELHFNTKRISVLFRDIDPSRSGTVKWKQFEDRVVVTWQNVTEYAPSNSNTFQVEMYFDGRIQLAWLKVESQGGIVGLSQGQGLPGDFQEADFSAFPGPNQGNDPADPGTPGSSGRRNRKK